MSTPLVARPQVPSRPPRPSQSQRAFAEHTGAEPINYEETDVAEALQWMTAGRGPDACIDAVGLEAHQSNRALQAYDRTKQVARLETDRPHALREAILSCRNGGTVSVIGPTRTWPRPGVRTMNSYVPGTRLTWLVSGVAALVSATGTARAS